MPLSQFGSYLFKTLCHTLKFLASFEIFFTLWLFSYQYKNAWDILLSPDITILLTFVLIVWAICIHIQQKLKFHNSTLNFRVLSPCIIAFSIFSLWLIITTAWSHSHNYMLQKTVCYIFYIIPGFLMGSMIIMRQEMRLQKVVIAFGIFASFILMECLWMFATHGLAIIKDVLQTNYLVTGQTLGVGVLILWAWSFHRHLHSKTKINSINILWILSFLIISLFIYALLNLGGRGPIMAVVIVMALSYTTTAVQWSFKKSFIHAGILIAVCLIISIILNAVFHQSESHFVQRTLPLLSGHGDASIQERLDYYISAFHAFCQHPWLGLGMGGWPTFHGFEDISIYPHNIFLELLSETGIIGFVLFSVLLILSLKTLKQNVSWENQSYIYIALMVFFSLLNALKSGDLNDNLLLFVSLSFCAGLKTRGRVHQ